MTALDVLKEARKLLDHPEAWIKGTDAVNADGETDPADPTAYAFCALGALDRVAGGPAWQRYDAAYQALKVALPPQARDGVASFNDSEDTEHEDIIALYDTAIELLESSTA